jgi:ABC-type nitrate/sulfonate/bicarbonate transport system substrate-binding protein
MSLKSLSYSAAALTLALSLSGPTLAATKLTVASPSIGSSNAPTVIAIQKGFFKDADLEVTVFGAGGGNNAVSTVIGGDAQIALVGIRNASKPVEKGQPLKIIALETKGLAQVIFVRADLYKESGLKPTSTLAEKGAFLKGKRIAVNDLGGSSGEFARYVLAAAGLGERDATIVNINSEGARQSALKAGKIDGIVATSPAPETAVVGGYGAVLVDPNLDLADIKDVASTIHVVRADFLEKNRDVLQRYVDAVERGRKFIKSNPEEAKRAYYTYVQAEAQGSAEPDSKVADLAWKNVQANFGDSLVLTRQQYANAQSFFKIPDSVTYEKIIDNSLVGRAGN